MSLAFLGLQLTYIVRLVNLRVYVSQFLIINFYTHTHTHTIISDSPESCLIQEGGMWMAKQSRGEAHGNRIWADLGYMFYSIHSISYSSADAANKESEN